MKTSPTHHRAIALVVVIVAALALARVGIAPPLAHGPPWASPQHHRGGDEGVDPNTATAMDLESLPGVGPVLARRIVASRRGDQPFCRVEDLTRVRGIGPRAVNRLRPRVRFGPPCHPAGSTGQ